MELLERRVLLATAAAPLLYDSSFGVGGITRSPFGIDPPYGPRINFLASLSDGKILAAGGGSGDEPIHLARFTVDGLADSTFGAAGRLDVLSEAYDLRGGLLQPDGKFDLFGKTADGLFVARFNPNGTIDSSFGAAGVATTNNFGGLLNPEADGAVLQSDGKIVL